jgi:hypothetical protein
MRNEYAYPVKACENEIIYLILYRFSAIDEGDDCPLFYSIFKLKTFKALFLSVLNN